MSTREEHRRMLSTEYIANASVKEAIGLDYLAEWMAEVDKRQRSVGEFKEEMRGVLNKTREANTEITHKNDAFIDSMNEVIQNIVNGVNLVEQRTSALWNTLNTVIEFLKDEVTTNGDYTAESFVRAFSHCGKKLFDQAMAHRTAEIARIQAEKRSGAQPQPMRPYPATTGDEVLAAVVGLTSVPNEAPDDVECGETGDGKGG